MSLTSSQRQEAERLREVVAQWLQEEGLARSTLAGAVVVVDTIRIKAPFTPADVFTLNGQLVGGRGPSLVEILERYGEERRLLADGVTTRSTRKFQRLAEGLEWGVTLEDWSDAARQEAVSIIAEPALIEIDKFFQRQHMKLKLDLGESSVIWIEQLMETAKDRSQGRVEQHLIGAKLKTRLPNHDVTGHAAFAGDVQTARSGDFVIGNIVYHVTAAPAIAVIRKCVDNLRQNLAPVLVVPRDKVDIARGLAQSEEGAERRISVLSIEDFVASNIIELASEYGATFGDVLQSILDIYNELIESSETDGSLRIELD